jgi:hypothetical protein
MEFEEDLIDDLLVFRYRNDAAPFDELEGIERPTSNAPGYSCFLLLTGPDVTEFKSFFVGR